MKILVLTSRFPYPLEKGDKLRIYHQLKVLSSHHEIILISLCLKKLSTTDKEMIDKIVDKQYIYQLPQWKRVLAVVKGFFLSKPFRNSYFYSNAVQNEVDQIIAEHKPDHIYCHLIRMADYVRSSELPTTIDFMDCFSAGAVKRMKASSGLQSWFFKKEYQLTKAYERSVSADFDNHTIISEQDQQDMPVDDKNKIQVIKNGIDLDYFKQVKSEKKYDIGFVGNLGYYPNVEAAKYLVDEIVPLLPDDMTIVLAGARPTQAVQQLASSQIIVTGWVEDIRIMYASISIFVAPLFKGIGLQNKILEAMAMGIPVITSSLVNNAIGAKVNVEILVADTPEEFKNAIIKLQNDPELYDHLSQNALEFVKENYSWQQVTQPLLDLIG